MEFITVCKKGCKLTDYEKRVLMDASTIFSNLSGAGYDEIYEEIIQFNIKDFNDLSYALDCILDEIENKEIYNFDK